MKKLKIKCANSFVDENGIYRSAGDVITVSQEFLEAQNALCEHFDLPKHDVVSEAEEPEAEEPEAEEPEAEEPEAEEPEAKEPEAKEPEAKEPEAKDSPKTGKRGRKPTNKPQVEDL